MCYPKFILTNTDRFRLGRVNLHRDLLKPGEHCLGGGFYEFDYVNGRILLSGKSYDYGRPKWHCFDQLYVPKAYEGLRLVYSSDEEWEDAFDVGANIRLIYE
ncbi:MAG: hypothetical protein J6C91_05920 [Muribaculaceae bacterium]|nr:hypothetical protein [Muribaculaceae bacterium]